VKVPAGKTASKEVVEERDAVQTVSLTNSDDQQMRFFLQTNVGSPKVQAALKQAIELRTRLATTQRELQQQQRLLGDITQDQVRLRANLEGDATDGRRLQALPRQVRQQETEIEKLQATIKQLQEAEHLQKKAHEIFLGALDVE